VLHLKRVPVSLPLGPLGLAPDKGRLLLGLGEPLATGEGDPEALATSDPGLSLLDCL